MQKDGERSGESFAGHEGKNAPKPSRFACDIAKAAGDSVMKHVETALKELMQMFYSFLCMLGFRSFELKMLLLYQKCNIFK